MCMNKFEKLKKTHDKNWLVCWLLSGLKNKLRTQKENHNKKKQIAAIPSYALFKNEKNRTRFLYYFFYYIVPFPVEALEVDLRC